MLDYPEAWEATTLVPPHQRHTIRRALAQLEAQRDRLLVAVESIRLEAERVSDPDLNRATIISNIHTLAKNAIEP